MTKPPIPQNEISRQAELNRLGILDTPKEEQFEFITKLACNLLDVPVAAFSLVDTHRQWFKSIHGLDVQETSRDVSFCAHCIAQNNKDNLVVQDATLDERFSDNPLVTGDLHLRFYAGNTVSYNDKKLGALCVIDYKPRNISEEELLILQKLSELLQREIMIHDTIIKYPDLNTLLVTNNDEHIDQLTNLYNLKGMTEIFNNIISNKSKLIGKYLLCKCSISEYTSCVDTYGNPIGIEIQMVTAKILCNMQGKFDFIARTRPNCFYMLIYVSNLQVAQDYMELVNYILKKALITNNYPELKFTAQLCGKIIDTEAGSSLAENIKDIEEHLGSASKVENIELLL